LKVFIKNYKNFSRRTN